MWLSHSHNSNHLYFLPIYLSCLCFSAVYPIAIKYNKNFADAFWDSRQFSFASHLLNLMTSWAIVADVWYIPVQTINEGESASDFAMVCFKKEYFRILDTE